MTLDELNKTACPIFRLLPGGKPEHIASGVLLQIVDDVFLLTAAHVTDQQDEGELLVPGENHLMSIRGYFAHIPVHEGSTRAEDKIDVAYYRLLPDVVKKLHPSLKVLTREHVFLCDELDHRDLYTFAGFPWRKTKVSGVTYETSFYTFTGGAMPPETYKALGYDPTVHILIRFQRKKSFSFQRQTIEAAPLPEGLSGGGVFAWPKDAATRKDKPDLKLVGIAHTFHETNHCMAATRLNTYVACIVRNKQHANASEPTKGIQEAPLLPTIVWYQKEEWDQLMASFDDKDKMQGTWQEWRQAALSHMEAASQGGVPLLPVEVRLDELREYCRTHGVPNTSQTRVDFACRKFAAAWFASEKRMPERGGPTSA